MLRKALIGFVGVNVLGGGAYAYRRAANRRVSAEDFNQQGLAQLKQWELPSTSSLEDRKQFLNDSNLKLFAFHHCPFCSKVEMFLACNGIEYDKLMVNRITKQELSSHAYKKVPQLQFGGPDGPVLGDCKTIVTQLAHTLGDQNVGQPEVEKWREWSSSVLARYVVLEVNADFMTNVSFLFNTPGLSTFERVFFVTASPFLKLVIHPATERNLKKLNKDTSQPKLGLHAELDAWAQALNGQTFYGGETPNVCDSDVYGVLFGVKRHPMYDELKQAGSPALQRWLAGMEHYAPSDTR